MTFVGEKLGIQRFLIRIDDSSIILSVPVSIKFHDKFLILLISFSLIVWFDVAMNLSVAIAILLMVMIPPYVSFFLQQHLL